MAPDQIFRKNNNNHRVISNLIICNLIVISLLPIISCGGSGDESVNGSAPSTADSNAIPQPTHQERQLTQEEVEVRARHERHGEMYLKNLLNASAHNAGSNRTSKVQAVLRRVTRSTQMDHQLQFHQFRHHHAAAAGQHGGGGVLLGNPDGDPMLAEESSQSQFISAPLGVHPQQAQQPQQVPVGPLAPHSQPAPSAQSEPRTPQKSPVGLTHRIGIGEKATKEELKDSFFEIPQHHLPYDPKYGKSDVEVLPEHFQALFRQHAAGMAAAHAASSAGQHSASQASQQHLHLLNSPQSLPQPAGQQQQQQQSDGPVPSIVPAPPGMMSSASGNMPMVMQAPVMGPGPKPQLFTKLHKQQNGGTTGGSNGGNGGAPIFWHRKDDLFDDQEGPGQDLDPTRPTTPKADIKRLEASVNKMFAVERNDISNATHKDWVRQAITDKFLDVGLQTWTHTFNAVEMELMNMKSINGTNIIGVLPGKNRGRGTRDGLLLIGAHYDTVLGTPGANDNGSGMAILLEIARLLSGHLDGGSTPPLCGPGSAIERRHTIMFVAFDLEEYGGVGARHFIHDYLIPYELMNGKSNFLGAYLLDTLANYATEVGSQDIPNDLYQSLPDWAWEVKAGGFIGDFVGLVSRGSTQSNPGGPGALSQDARLTKALRAGWQRVSNADSSYRLSSMTAAQLPATMPPVMVLAAHANILRSDHVMFWYHNSSDYTQTLPAVLLTDTGPYRGYMRKCYHARCDSAGAITERKYHFMRHITEALVDTSIDLASISCQPQINTRPRQPHAESATLTNSGSASGRHFEFNHYNTNHLISIGLILIHALLSMVLTFT